jgi:hypothetical protein
MPRYTQLLETFPNIETAIENGLINIIANDYNKKFSSSYEWGKYQSKQYPIDKLKKHKGNYGIIIGYYPTNKGYWVGCLDIDGIKKHPETLEKGYKYMNETKEDLYNILRELKDVIIVRSQSGGYHIYFLTKTSYKQQALLNINFPKDYHIKELQGKPLAIKGIEPSVELFTNNTRQMAIPPSKIGKNKYEVISDLKDFTKLKPYEDIVKTVTDLFLANEYTYKKTENYITNDRPLTSEELEEIETKQSKSTITEDDLDILEDSDHTNTIDTKYRQLTQFDINLISHKLAPYFAVTSGIHSELYMALSGYLKNHKIAKQSTIKIVTQTMELSNDKNKDHLREVKSTYKRTNKKQTGLKRFKELLEKNKKIDKKLLANDIKILVDIIEPKNQLKTFTPHNNTKVDEFNKLIATKYDNNVTKYITDTSKLLILDEEYNILKQILINLATVIFKEGLFNQVQGDKDTGKTYTIETGLKYVPKEHLQKINSTTRASFIDQANLDKHCYEQMILYGGDLGDKETLEHIKNEIFDILKILVSENEYINYKMIQNEGEWIQQKTKIVGGPGFAFCTVEPLISSKSQQQVDSRTITTSPLKHDRQSKLRFQNKIKREYTNENRNYNKTIIELDLFHEYVRDLRDNLHKYSIDIVFYETIDDFTSLAETDTRQATLQKTLFKVYCYMNKTQCYEYKIGNKRLLMPTIELLESYFKMMVGDVGLKRYEKDVLLSLKEYLQIPTDKEVNKLITDMKGEIEDNNDYMPDDRVESKSVANLITEYGLNKNRQKQKLKKSETYFFTVSKFNQMYKKDPDLKHILNNIGNSENVQDLFKKLYDEGYLERTELLYRKNYIYYLTDKINDIKLEYKFKEDIFSYDIKQLETLKNNNNQSILGDKKLKELKAKYVNSSQKM